MVLLATPTFVPHPADEDLPDLIGWIILHSDRHRKDRMKFRVARMRTVDPKQSRHDRIFSVDLALDSPEFSTLALVPVKTFVIIPDMIHRLMEFGPPASRKVVDGFVRIKFNPQAGESRGPVYRSLGVRP